MTEQSQINALIALLDEPSSKMYEEIKTSLVKLGIQTIDELSDAIAFSSNALVVERAKNIVQCIKIESITQDFQTWVDGRAKDLLTGAIILARYNNINIDTDKIIKEVGKISQDIWIEINDELTALEKVVIINRIIFEKYKFKGEHKHFEQPENYFIDEFLNLKKGSPLTLGVLYISISNSLNIPIYGVDLPLHFVLAYQDKNNLFDQSKALFYIDAFSKGTAFDFNELKIFINRMELELKPEYYAIIDNKKVILRIIYNLNKIYEKHKNHDAINDMKLIEQILLNN